MYTAIQCGTKGYGNLQCNTIRFQRISIVSVRKLWYHTMGGGGGGGWGWSRFQVSGQKPGPPPHVRKAPPTQIKRNCPPA